MFDSVSYIYILYYSYLAIIMWLCVIAFALILSLIFIKKKNLIFIYFSHYSIVLPLLLRFNGNANFLFCLFKRLLQTPTTYKIDM